MHDLLNGVTRRALDERGTAVRDEAIQVEHDELLALENLERASELYHYEKFAHLLSHKIFQIRTKTILSSFNAVYRATLRGFDRAAIPQRNKSTVEMWQDRPIS
ncbi:MAG: hypothetical protein RID91_06885 [Azospirillaceae bacterium]